MRKKILSIFIAVIMLLSLTLVATAANNKSDITAELVKKTDGFSYLVVTYTSNNNSVSAGIFEILTANGTTSLLKSPVITFANKSGTYSFKLEIDIPKNAVIRMTEDKKNNPVIATGVFADGFTLVPPESKSYTTTCFATVESGTMIGYNYNGTYTFLGVAYGQAERFERATKVKPWNGLYLALSWGESSYQIQTEFNPRDLGCAVGPDMVFSEDCLYLNVWSQSLDETAKKPVVVFIHGGGLTTGGSSELDCYDLTNLSAAEDLVCVSLNHRLDVFGYMDLSAYDEKYAESGNNSLTDIILALEWVRDNIEKFGGDPKNVTLIGQSGGAMKISVLIGMTDAQGLYQKVDMHSGFLTNSSSARTVASARQSTQSIVNYLGITGTNEEIVAQLKAVDPLTLLAAGSATRFSSNPVAGTALYPQQSFNRGEVSPVFLENKVPIMVSTVLGEMNSNFGALSYRAASDDFTDYYIPGMTDEYVRERIARQWGAGKVDAIIAAWEKAYPGKPIGDIFFTASRSDVFATMMVNAGVTVYQSVYAYDYPILGGVVSVHSGGDLPLIFKNLTFRDARLFAGDEYNARNISDAASGALRAFAYTGNPSTASLEFEQFTVETGASMIWDVNPEIRYYHDADLMSLIY